MNGPTVIVVGGGLAGLAAACTLSGRGSAVTLVEQRSRLGGATFSFPRGDVIVDNGQHVLLRCYTEYLRFLRTIGTEGKIDFQRRFAIPVQGPDGRRHRLERTTGLPAPAHLGPALLRYGLVSPLDRARILRAVVALRGLRLDDPRLDEQSFGAWLRANGQTASTIAALWDLITVAALNTTAEDAALSLCAMVFRTALLERADAADIGVPRVPLQELHGEAAEKYLRERGNTVLLDTPARAITPAANGFRVRLDTTTLEAERVILAVPARHAVELLPAEALDVTVRTATSPIVNVHVIYDRTVLDEPMLAFVGSPVQWVFDRTAVSGLDRGQYVAVSLSAAQQWIDRPTAQLRDRFLPELARLLPIASVARVEQFFVTRERNATFRQHPGSARHRATAHTRLPGLAIAGAWTATGWPDTMEGAVRSGLTAVREVTA